jgi:hypothetical protein
MHAGGVPRNLAPGGACSDTRGGLQRSLTPGYPPNTPARPTHQPGLAMAVPNSKWLILEGLENTLEGEF